MSSVPLGELHCSNAVLRITEPLRDTLNMSDKDSFTVTLAVGQCQMELDLAAVRKAKQILLRAEQQLVLRQEQALKAKNLKLDF